MVPKLRLRQGSQYLSFLAFPVARDGPVDEPAVDEEPDPVALSEEVLRQRRGSSHRMLEERFLPSPHLGDHSSIEDNAHVGGALLLEEVGDEQIPSSPR